MQIPSAKCLLHERLLDISLLQQLQSIYSMPPLGLGGCFSSLLGKKAEVSYLLSDFFFYIHFTLVHINCHIFIDKILQIIFSNHSSQAEDSHIKNCK